MSKPNHRDDSRLSKRSEAETQALPRIARAGPDSGHPMGRLMATIAAGDDEAKSRMNAFLEKRAAQLSHSAAGEAP